MTIHTAGDHKTRDIKNIQFHTLKNLNRVNTTAHCTSEQTTNKEQTPHSPFSCFEPAPWKTYLKSAFPSDCTRGGAPAPTCPQHLNGAVAGHRQSTRAVWFTWEGPWSTAIEEVSPEAFLQANF